jgi:hypothetical protein
MHIDVAGQNLPAIEAAVPGDDWNQKAVEVLQADAHRALALTEFEDVKGNREILRDTVAIVHWEYINLVRRGLLLIMSDGDQAKLQGTLDCIRARLRFFGEKV